MRHTKNIACFFFLWTVVFLSCDRADNHSTAKGASPKALENNSASEVVLPRGDNDLAASLYVELTDKTPELKGLENNIAILADSRGDSAKAFNQFDAKNHVYYNSAGRHTEQIKDSLLRVKLAFLIKNSLTKYEVGVSGHTALLRSIDAKSLALNDLHEFLKVVRTLAVIERFQKESLPGVQPMEGYLKKLNETIRQTDSLTKK